MAFEEAMRRARQWVREILAISGAFSVLWVVPVAAWPGLFLLMLAAEATYDFFRKKR